MEAGSEAVAVRIVSFSLWLYEEVKKWRVVIDAVIGLMYSIVIIWMKIMTQFDVDNGGICRQD